MNQWLADARALRERNEAFVIVTVAATRGSTPRETGAKMLVTRHRALGSIGGGHLEHRCTEIACEWFQDLTPARSFRRKFTLGANLGQCCGGIVQVLFEQIAPEPLAWLDCLLADGGAATPGVLVTTRRGAGRYAKCLLPANESASQATPDPQLAAVARGLLQAGKPAQWLELSLADGERAGALFEPLLASDFEIVVFGAGHVGSALVDVLAPLSCRVTWVDSRAGLFPASTPANVNKLPAEDPQHLVDTLGPGRYYLVMTHSHPLDLAICARVLRRRDYAFCGLIGSRSKRLQFERRLRALGLTDADLSGLICPIGVDGIHGKRPAEIAVAVAAQLLQLRQAELDSRAEAPAAASARPAGIA